MSEMRTRVSFVGATMADAASAHSAPIATPTNRSSAPSDVRCVPTTRITVTAMLAATNGDSSADARRRTRARAKHSRTSRKMTRALDPMSDTMTRAIAAPRRAPRVWKTVSFAAWWKVALVATAAVMAAGIGSANGIASPRTYATRAAKAVRTAKRAYPLVHRPVMTAILPCLERYP